MFFPFVQFNFEEKTCYVRGIWLANIWLLVLKPKNCVATIIKKVIGKLAKNKLENQIYVIFTFNWDIFFYGYWQFDSVL